VDTIPLGSKVVGTAWHGAEQREAILPTDPFTELEVHMRARRRIVPPERDSVELEHLIPEERAIVAKDFPWVDEPRLPVAVAELTVVDNDEPVDDAEYFDELVENLGLDAESSEWLRELLDEDEPR
jgi:hypothetical protein